MKEIMFSKLKGKINKNPNNYALIFQDSDIQIEQTTIILKCRNKEEYFETLKFLLSYYYNTLDRDDKALKIYMSRNTICKINNLDENYEEIS